MPEEGPGPVGIAAGDDGAAGLVVAGQLLGRDLLAVAGVAGAVAVEVIGQDVALGAVGGGRSGAGFSASEGQLGSICY